MSDTPRTDAHYETIYSDCEGIEFTRALEREIGESEARVTALQRALMFWMPTIAGNGTEAGERAAEDSYLLVCYPGSLEKSAEDLGWVYAMVRAIRDRGSDHAIVPAGDVIHIRGLPFRLVRETEVYGANITLADYQGASGA
jgi:hypothetical protein